MAFATQFKHHNATSVTAKGGRTKQAALDDADINRILRKYNLNRIPPPTSAPIYADQVIMPKTLEDAIAVVENANQWFSELPAEVRQTFDNDPTRALELVATNIPSAIEKGLLPRPASSESILAKAAAAATPEPQKKAAEGAAATEEKTEPKA